MTDKDKLEKLKKLADTMYYAAQYLTTDASKLHKAMEEYHKFIIHEYKEEPSEDLEKEIEKFLDYSNLLAPIREVEFIAYYFANWQKEQFEKNRLKHCNSITNEQAELESDFIDQHFGKYQRMPTFLDAIEYGMRLQKQKLMAKAFDVTIAIPYPNCDCGYTQLVYSNKALPFGENLKVLVIKED